MKAADVHVGGTYTAKISGNVVAVQIEEEQADGGWKALNLKTGKIVRIKSSRKLRAAVVEDTNNCACGGQIELTVAGEPMCSECWEKAEAARPAEESDVQESEAPNDEEQAGAEEESTEAGEDQPDEEAPESPPAKRKGALEAAAEVLRNSSEPMKSKELIAAMEEQGLWTSPGGRTPHATLYSAITREIQAKRDEARFRKVGKGMFEANEGNCVSD